MPQNFDIHLYENQVRRILAPYSLRKWPVKITLMIIYSLLVLFFLTLIVFFAWRFGPNLWQDWLGGDDWAVDTTGKVAKGTCDIDPYLIITCNFNISASQAQRNNISYAFFAWDLDKLNKYKEYTQAYGYTLQSIDYQPQILVSQKNPNIVSTNLGIDYFMKRLITLFILEFFLIIGLIFILKELLRTLRYIRIQRYVQSNKPFIKLVSLSLTHSSWMTNPECQNQKYPKHLINKAIKDDIWSFQPINKATNQNKYLYQPVSNNFYPFCFYALDIGTLGIAVISADQRHAILLDYQLQLLNMSPYEREDVLAKFEGINDILSQNDH